MKKNLLIPAVAAALVIGAAPAWAAAPSATLDRKALTSSLKAMADSGVYGVQSSVRAGAHSWRGAAGVADIETRRPMKAGMYHRIGSITKTFTAAAVLREVGLGRIKLDEPVNTYVPGLIPGQRGKRITVRMLLNHTSHVGDHIRKLFGSLEAFDDNQFRTFSRRELARIGLAEKPTGEPGARPGSYSNVNYAIAGLVLEKVTGQRAETYITRHIIKKAGLRHTFFPRSAYLPQPHPKAYEGLEGQMKPERDYSVYDMSWANLGGSLVSTMDDVNRYYRLLLRGKVIGRAQVKEMLETAPIYVSPGVKLDYGLGIARVKTPCGTFWSHTGLVWGFVTAHYTSADTRRQLTIGYNRTTLPKATGKPLGRHTLQALCGSVKP
ncbi:serine hydrolase domain-containing protein [Nonomuraea endophytica]|uniref:serine hydrolase domain-containing protein n=1 Tax=Nonomuraea endophytica TaxID=714136 RepID=UPI0037CA4293